MEGDQHELGHSYPSHRLSRSPTDVGGQLLGGVRGQLGDLQDHVTVGLHCGSGNRAQPVVSHVVQLRQFVPWKGKYMSVHCVILSNFL